MSGEVARLHPRASVRAPALAAGATVLALLIAAGAALAAAGDLDSGFGSGGKVTTGISQASSDFANAVALQTDGKSVAVGASNGTLAVARYNTNGTLDTGFGGDGTVTTDFGIQSSAQAVAIQSDGKIVVAGFAASFQVGGQGPGDFAVARYNTDGTLDTSFSGDGKLTTDIDGGSGDQANAVAIQANGAIVAGGFSGPQCCPSDFALVRYTSGGALDTSFDNADADGNGQGKVTTDFGSTREDAIRGIAIQPSDQAIVVGGTSNDQSADSDFAVARYNPDGTLDNTTDSTPSTNFNTNGFRLTDFSGSGSDDQGNGLALQADGKIVVAGSSGGSFALARYTTGGALDTAGFGTGGLVTTSFGGNGGASGVAMSGTDIVAGGTEGGDFAAARYQTDGTLDDTTTPFSGDGKQTTDIGGQDEGRAVAVQTGGEVVIAGSVTAQSPFFEQLGDFIVIRYTSAGALDTAGFGGGDGIVDSLIGNAFEDRGQAMAVQSDGKILVAGSTVDEQGQDDEDFAIARFTSGGTLDPTFSGGDGSDGILSFDFSGADLPDVATSIAIQPSDGKIVVAGFSPATDFDFAVARLNTDGTLDTSSDITPGTNFSGDGKQTTDFGGGGSDFGRSVAIQADGKIVVAGSASPSGNPEVAVARYNTGGALDSGFSAPDGIVTTGVGPDSQANGVAIQSADQKIVVAGSGTGGFAVVRYTTVGAPDPAFGGGDGIATADFSGAPNQGANDVAIQSDGAIITAGFRFGEDAPVPRCFTGAVDEDFALARFTSTGGPDNTFDGDGKLTTGFAGFDKAFGVGLQSDGAIVAAGETAGDFGLARYAGGGALDGGFGAGGKVVTDFNAGSCDEGNDVAITSAGILAAGTSDGRFALARYAETTSVTPPAAPAAPSNAFSLGGLKGTNLTLNVGATGSVSVVDAGAAAASNRASAARSSRRLNPSSARAAGPGQVIVPLRLTKLAKKLLRQKGKVRVVPRITFTPDGGSPNSQVATLKVRKKRPG